MDGDDNPFRRFQYEPRRGKKVPAPCNSNSRNHLERLEDETIVGIWKGFENNHVHCEGNNHILNTPNHHHNPNLSPDFVSFHVSENKAVRQPPPNFCTQFKWKEACVAAGFLIVIGALGIGVVLPLALEMGQETEGVASRLLREVPLIDGHNDLPWNIRKYLNNRLDDLKLDQDLSHGHPWGEPAWTQTDLVRMRAGGVGAQLWSAYVPCSAQHADAVQLVLEQIDVIRRLVDRYPSFLRLVTSLKDIERARAERRIGSVIGVEGGHAIGNSLAVLRMLYALGARVMTLTHNCHTPWADAAASEQILPSKGGLSDFGRLVVLEMNRLGMVVDLAHVSTDTMRAALGVSRAPVIFSHSAAAALCNHSRNVPDDVLRLLSANGGLVMVSFYNVFLKCNESATMRDVIDHLEHIKRVAGPDHVGLGAGFDGINHVPVGLEDVGKYPRLVEALAETWSEAELRKLLALNFFRVFGRVEAIRDELRHVTPIEELIPRPDLDYFPAPCPPIS